MIIYIDDDFKCHVSNPDGTRRAFDVPFFGGKCTAFIKGYRYLPAGERWVQPNGMFYLGEMISPWVAYDQLEAAQKAYEEALQQSSAEALIDAAGAAYAEGVNTAYD